MHEIPVHQVLLKKLTCIDFWFWAFFFWCENENILWDFATFRWPKRISADFQPACLWTPTASYSMTYLLVSRAGRNYSTNTLQQIYWANQIQLTLLFYQIEPSKNGPSPVFPSSHTKGTFLATSSIPFFLSLQQWFQRGIENLSKLPESRNPDFFSQK